MIAAGFLPQWEAVMADSDDKGPVGSSRRHAGASLGRIGDDVQRAKENISGAAATARDDITADLHRLSADVASLRDTVASLAKTLAAEVGPRRGPTLATTSHLPRRTKQTPCCPNSMPSRVAIRWASSSAPSE